MLSLSRVLATFITFMLISLINCSALTQMGMPASLITAGQSCLAEVEEVASRRLKRKHSRLDSKSKDLDKLYEEQQKLFAEVINGF